MPEEKALMPTADTIREVSEEPEVVARVLSEQHSKVCEVARTLAARNVRQLFIAGNGDSYFGAQTVRMAFESYTGLPMEVFQAYEYATYGRPGIDESSCMIAISSSGRKSTARDALDRVLSTEAYVIGITDKQKTRNPFIEKPHFAIVPGATKIGWPTQTTVATIAVLIDLAIELGRARGQINSVRADTLLRKLTSIPEKMKKVLDESENHAEKLAQRLYERPIFTFIGSGPGLGVANLGAALFAEGPQRAGVVLPVEEFHHALMFSILSAEDPVILISPNGAAVVRYIDTARSVKRWGSYLISIVDEYDQAIRKLSNGVFTLPPVPEPMSALLTLMPLHQLSIKLALRRAASGHQRPTRVP